MAKITKLQAREISDSRNNSTLAVELELEGQFSGQASVPAGASTGEHEAVALPAREAIGKVNDEIKQKLLNDDFNQTSLDAQLIALDDTLNKNHLGANATLGVSLAFTRALAKSQNKELFEIIANGEQSWERSPTSSEPEVGLRSPFPLPMFNILNGGRHANSIDWQEFMVVPIGATSSTESLAWGKIIWQKLKDILETKGLETELGDEGGFAPKLATNQQALDLILEAIKSAGLKPGQQVALALDVAASELKNGLDYEFKKEGKILNSTELIDLYASLVEKYPLISIEDGLSENDWLGWQELTTRLGNKINLVGDDLFVTNPARLREGLDKKVANAIIIKPNQIGTLTETLAVVRLAQTAGYKIIVSHRSGETLDSFIADLAVGIGADFLKAGAPSRPERLAKYDRLIEIEIK